MEPNKPFDVEAEVEPEWCKVEGGYVNAAFIELAEDVEGESDESESAEDGEVSEAPEEDCELFKMKVPELKQLAADSGIAVTSTMKKNEIIEAILNA